MCLLRASRVWREPLEKESSPFRCPGLKQDAETFLSEMIVMRQDFADAILPHDLHRDAVGQAVPFVGGVTGRGRRRKERSAGTAGES